MKKTKNNYLWYIVIVMAISYLWQYILFRTGGIESPLFTFLMWIPGLMAIVFRIVYKEGFKNVGWGLGKWWTIFLAIFVPLAVSVGIAYLFVLVGWGKFARSIFVFKNGMVEISSVKLILSNQPQNIPFFIMNFIVSHALFLIAGTILTFGEEFGWRGYLQEKMLRKFGLNRGFIFLGIIWGYWHAPVILMGFNFPNHPVLGALLLMPLGVISLGIFLGWIYLRSRSIWITALTHTSGNLFSGIVFQFILMKQNELFRHMAWITTWAIIAILCLIDLNRNKPDLWQKMNIVKDNNTKITEVV
jgi:membrane protease YdiL (CAAX protease family)